MAAFSFDVQIHKEGDMFVAHAPRLDVSSCGYTEEEARQNIREAVRLFLETAARMGTLREILQESGYPPAGI
jgi:predicted RNase H-like HicB family nuclease